MLSQHIYLTAANGVVISKGEAKEECQTLAHYTHSCPCPSRSYCCSCFFFFHCIICCTTRKILYAEIAVRRYTQHYTVLLLCWGARALCVMMRLVVTLTTRVSTTHHFHLIFAFPNKHTKQPEVSSRWICGMHGQLGENESTSLRQRMQAKESNVHFAAEKWQR